MKKAVFLLALCFLTSSCSFKKSEESVVLKIDTASVLKGRSIDASVLIKNSEKAEKAD